MQRYFDNSLWIDLCIGFFLGIILHYGRPFLSEFVDVPSFDKLNGFNVSLITVGATLVGFLLTIITVIVTFKQGFVADKGKHNHPDKVNPDPLQNIFDQKRSKTSIFYDTPIHKAVISVFISATYEIVLILVLLLILQLNEGVLPLATLAIVTFSIFILLVLTITRSLYVFHLFLSVHTSK